jgi:hypothetical protein
MFDLIIVKKALVKSLVDDSNAEFLPANPAEGQDSLISLLVHDIFGGEILKTHKKGGWHFYNRVEGLRIDLSSSEIEIQKKANRFEDIPCPTSEIKDYFAREDYSSLFMRFVQAFEEIVGLKKHHVA